MVIGVENGCQVYDISLHQIVKRCLTSLWIISTFSDLNIVFQVHSAAVISKRHMYFQDMYNIDTFIANCKTNDCFASQTSNSKFYFLLCKKSLCKVMQKMGGIPPTWTGRSTISMIHGVLILL